MELSIIVLNYNTKNLLRECLQSIRFVNPQLDYEVVVVDNASNDGSVQMIEAEFPEYKLVRSETNLGYAGGNNLGLSNANGKYVMIMNPDIFLVDGALEELVRYLDNNPKVGLVGPRLLNGDKKLQESCYRFHSLVVPILRRTPLGKTSWGEKRLNSFLMQDISRDKPVEVDWLLGGAIVARRKAIEDVGNLDDKFFLYFDDVDWCRRFWENGWKVMYVPLASLIHLHQRASEGNVWGVFTNRVMRVHIRSAAFYFKKYWKKPNPRTGKAIRI